MLCISTLRFPFLPGKFLPCFSLLLESGNGCSRSASRLFCNLFCSYFENDILVWCLIKVFLVRAGVHAEILGCDIYRVEKGSEEWKYKAYDYVRTDAFCCGQNIPIELEFGQDESKDDLQAILLTEDHKPVAGCRIAFPAEKTGKIERVCVVREKQKSGYGRVLIEAAEKWLKEYGALSHRQHEPGPRRRLL